MTDRTPLAKATIARARAMGMPYTYDALYGEGLTLFDAVMKGADPDEALRQWREGRG